MCAVYVCSVWHLSDSDCSSEQSKYDSQEKDRGHSNSEVGEGRGTLLGMFTAAAAAECVHK